MKGNETSLGRVTVSVMTMTPVRYGTTLLNEVFGRDPGGVFSKRFQLSILGNGQTAKKFGTACSKHVETLESFFFLV